MDRLESSRIFADVDYIIMMTYGQKQDISLDEALALSNVAS